MTTGRINQVAIVHRRQAGSRPVGTGRQRSVCHQPGGQAAVPAPEERRADGARHQLEDRPPPAQRLLLLSAREVGIQFPQFGAPQGAFGR